MRQMLAILYAFFSLIICIEVSSLLHSQHLKSFHKLSQNNIKSIEQYALHQPSSPLHQASKVLRGGPSALSGKKMMKSKAILLKSWMRQIKPLSQVFDHISSILGLFAGSFLSASIGGGFLSGGLHAITGPDHLAAILPASIGLSGWYGMKIGAIWGLGHGFSAIILGMAAFLLKGTVSTRFKYIDTLSSLAENAVGLSLITIGLFGLKENLMDNEGDHSYSLLSEKPRNTKAVFVNGVLHGFSWDGAPSLAPAIAMTSLRSTIIFLLSYCLGTMVMMSLASGALSEGSRRLGNASNNPEFSKNLSVSSSVIAILIGVFWIVKDKFI